MEEEITLVKRNLNLLRQAKRGALRVGDFLTAMEIDVEIREITKFYTEEGDNRWLN